MLQVTPPTKISMFPANYREFLLAPAAPVVPAAQQTLQPGEIYRLAQPKWPIDSLMPSFYALAATTILAATLLVAFKDVGSLINYVFRNKLGVAGNPVVGLVLSLLALTMILITYENDIKKRSGYYNQGSDPRYMVAFSTFASVCAILWASSTFQTSVSSPGEHKHVKDTTVANKVPKGSRRQQKKQAKREAKKATPKDD